MKKTENRAKHIKDLYKLDIDKDFYIVNNQKKVSVFEIGEICLLEEDKNVEQVIKNAYRACISGITVNYQILVKTDKIDMQEYLDEISKKQTKLLSHEFKIASERYINYIKNIWKSRQIYMTKYYLIASNLSLDDESNIKAAFKNIEELGIKIEKIENNKELYKLLKDCVIQR